MHRLLPLVLVGAALLAWEAASRSGLWSPLLFPSLAKIFDQLVYFFARPAMLGEALVSLGLSPQEAGEAMQGLEADGRPVEDLLREALQRVGR